MIKNHIFNIIKYSQQVQFQKNLMNQVNPQNALNSQKGHSDFQQALKDEYYLLKTLLFIYTIILADTYVIGFRTAVRMAILLLLFLIRYKKEYHQLLMLKATGIVNNTKAFATMIYRIFFVLKISMLQVMSASRQSDKLISTITSELQTLIVINQEQITELSRKFKTEFPRTKIQDEVEIDIFEKNTDHKVFNEYLSNPSKFIELKYHELISIYIKTHSTQFQRCFQNKRYKELINQLKAIISVLSDKFRSLSNSKSNESILKVVKSKSEVQTSINVESARQIAIAYYFLDLMVGKQQQIYTEQNVTFKVDQICSSIMKNIKPSTLLLPLVGKLKAKSIQISNIFALIDIVNTKLQIVQTVKTSEYQAHAINYKYFTTSSIQQYFKPLIIGNICKQQCPGCKKICGRQQEHSSGHQCGNGHQLRAFSGVKLINGDSSLLSCQKVHIDTPIVLNGKSSTWGEYIKTWQTKENGSWSFQDLDKFNPKTQLYKKAWVTHGQSVCKKYNMKFVEETKLNAIVQTPQTHYIFVLDESGSMGGQRWRILMLSFENTISSILNLPRAMENIRISIVMQGSGVIFQENVKPNEVRFDIKPQFGGNNFSVSFQKSYEIMNRYIENAKIKYIFMTDGGDSVPTGQIALIKALKYTYPNKIEYFGIQFQSDVGTMKAIQRQLQGKNIVSNNETELLNAYNKNIGNKVQLTKEYAEIINIKI